MKPENTTFASSTEAGQKILSKFLSVDELLMRPTADVATDPLTEQANTKKESPRISLERFQELEQCIRHSPADPQPYEELANIYFQQERWRDARRVLDQGVSHNPSYEPMLLLREETQLRLASQELEQSKRQLAKNRTEENELHRQRCETDLANLRLCICEARIERHPEQSDLMIPAAIALRQLGRMEEAIARLTTAQAVPQLRARASLQLGMCHQQLGEIPKALAAYRKAAIYRAPQPPLDIKRRSLELAAELSELHGLVHSAIQYLTLLLETSPADAVEIQKRLVRLQSSPL